MKLYLLENEAHPLDESLKKELASAGHTAEAIALPEDHEQLQALLEDHASGAVFLPAAWDDLFCVKTIDEVDSHARPFETVLVGPPPPLSRLIVAFNHGLTAFLETPVDPETLRLTLKRVEGRWKRSVETAELAATVELYRTGGSAHALSNENLMRDQLLGHALAQFASQEGPFFEGSVTILLASTSPSQQKQLASLLTRFGAQVTTVGTMNEAFEQLKDKAFTVVISDGVLPDGDALAFAARLRQEAKQSIPHFMVWSSSREKVPELLRPESLVNDVILKPGPDLGIESCLPAIVSAVYRMQG